eukprot:12398155-Karenia_brevis.AAC.1
MFLPAYDVGNNRSTKHNTATAERLRRGYQHGYGRGVRGRCRSGIDSEDDDSVIFLGEEVIIPDSRGSESESE